MDKMGLPFREMWVRIDSGQPIEFDDATHGREMDGCPIFRQEGGSKSNYLRANAQTSIQEMVINLGQRHAMQ
jgi:hypothetical protein